MATRQSCVIVGVNSIPRVLEYLRGLGFAVDIHRAFVSLGEIGSLQRFARLSCDIQQDSSYVFYCSTTAARLYNYEVSQRFIREIEEVERIVTMIEQIALTGE